MKDKYQHDTYVHNTRAASKIIPFLTGLFSPSSVIDVGCGTGTWMKVFMEHGITTVKGIEGHHLDCSALLVPRDMILLHDLEKPLSNTQKYDLAISLEVAEHLDPSVAPAFIEQLTRLSDVVVFSAAIPYQGGQNHLNEQWLSYWVTLFKKFNFHPYDIIRPAFWNDADVEFWYSQNMCVFVHESKPASNLNSLPTFNNNDVVHPGMYNKVGEYRRRSWAGELGLGTIGKMLAKKAGLYFKK